MCPATLSLMRCIPPSLRWSNTEASTSHAIACFPSGASLTDASVLLHLSEGGMQRIRLSRVRLVLICCTDQTSTCDEAREHQKMRFGNQPLRSYLGSHPSRAPTVVAGRRARKGRWQGPTGVDMRDRRGGPQGGGGAQMPSRPYLEHLSLGSGQGFQLLLTLLLAPAKGPLHASALALVSCHLGFLQKVIWQQLLKPQYDIACRVDFRGAALRCHAAVNSWSVRDLEWRRCTASSQFCAA